jgi:hypothetical protein
MSHRLRRRPAPSRRKSFRDRIDGSTGAPLPAFEGFELRLIALTLPFEVDLEADVKARAISLWINDQNVDGPRRGDVKGRTFPRRIDSP